MTNKNVTKSIRGSLIVSCQPVVGGPLDTVEIIKCQALAAEVGGANGVRVAGVDAVRSVAAASGLPIVGITKRDLDTSPVRITPTIDDVLELADAGAQIIAYDATHRPRPCPTASLVQAIRAAGALAMADCASIEDGQRALAEGAEIIATTLAGYTGPIEEENAPPDFGLVEQFAKLGAFVIAEGRMRSPQQAAQAISAGADSVVVGSAITRIEHITSWYAVAVKDESS